MCTALHAEARHGGSSHAVLAGANPQSRFLPVALSNPADGVVDLVRRYG
jgi:hypothetical protein